MKVFFFGLGYCARRLIQRVSWIEASGTARTAEAVAALRGEGVEAYRFDGVEADRGLEQALSQAEAIVVSIPPRDGPGAAVERFAAAIAAAPALSGASSIIRPSASMATMAAPGSTRRARP